MEGCDVVQRRGRSHTHLHGGSIFNNVQWLVIPIFRGRASFGRPLVKRFALCYRSVVCLSCLSVLSVTLVYCGQTVGWIKMPFPFGMAEGFGLRHTVLDGDPAPQKGHSSPLIFGPCLLWPNGWMDQDTTWYGNMPRPRPHCVRWGRSSPTERGTTVPTFLPMSIVAKRSPISTTAELLLFYRSEKLGQ